MRTGYQRLDKQYTRGFLERTRPMATLPRTQKTFVALLVATIIGTCTSASDAALYALYRFEDASGTIGSTIADSTSNAYDGTVFNAAIGFGPSPLPGQSGSFSANTGVVGADITGQGTTVGDFAIAFWMKPANNSQSQKYLTDRHPVAGGNQLAVIYEYDQDAVELFKGGAGGPDPRPVGAP